MLPREARILDGDAVYEAYLERQHEFLFHLRTLSTIKRLRACGLFVNTLIDTGSGFAEVKLNGRGKARWTGVCLCGLRWHCPVCAPYKAAQERRKLKTALCRVMLATRRQDFDAKKFHPASAEAAGVDLDAPKYGLIFLTATVPHHYSDALKKTLALVLKGWNYTTVEGYKKGLGGGRETWDNTFGVEGFARSLDVTVGGNGWHPHLHVAIVVRTDQINALGDGPLTVGGPDVSAEERFLAWFQAWFYRRWTHRVKSLLKLPEHAVGVHIRHGVQAEWARSPADVAAYVLKTADAVSMELTEGHRKGQDFAVGSGAQTQASVERRRSGQRAPFQLLADLCELDTMRALAQRITMTEAEEEEWRDILDEFDADLELWHEYEAGMKGRSALRTSRGFWSHPDFGVDHMTVEEQYQFLAESISPDERQEMELPEVVLSVVPWLFTALVVANLAGWVLRVVEGQGEGFKNLKEYCDSVSQMPRPPPGFSPKTLRWLVKLTEVARKADKRAESEAASKAAGTRAPSSKAR